MTEFNKLQTVKRHFFAMRNGIIAHTLRKGGSQYKIIFGLNVPQLREIAERIGYDSDLAEQLRRNVTTRESQLIFPMLIDSASVEMNDALQMVSETTSHEAADMLCHGLLRRLPFSFDLAQSLALEDKSDNERYCSMRLLWHHISSAHTDEVYRIASQEADRNCGLTFRLARQIVDEIEFLREE